MGFRWFFECKRKSLKWTAYNLVGNQRSIKNYLQDDSGFWIKFKLKNILLSKKRFERTNGKIRLNYKII